MNLRLLIPVALFALSLPLVAADGAAAAPSAPDFSAYKTADEFWKHMEKLQEKPTDVPTTREEAVTQLVKWFSVQKQAAEAFVQTFPSDPRSWQARMIALRASMQMRRFSGEKTDPAADQQKLDEVINAAEAPDSAKGEASFMSVMIKFAKLDKAQPESYAAFYKAATDALTKFPEHPIAGEMKSIVMQVLSEDPTSQGDALLKKLAEGGDPRLAEAAKATLAQKETIADLKKKPVDLKFTAVDGHPIDLANYRGKVVFIDFWASWCGPCMAEMPHVVSLYDQLHDKGLEIVGISLDQDKNAMEAALKEKKVSWPQYFDGGEGKIAKVYGVHAIPAAWLFDKKGMLREMNLHSGEEVEAALTKLLAE